MRKIFQFDSQEERSIAYVLAAMCFFVSMNYYLLKNLKDALLLTEKLAGAEVIPFVKGWVLFPSTILMAMGFTHLFNRIALKNVFRTMFLIFLTFFLLFFTLLYPYREAVYPHNFANLLQDFLPIGWTGFVALVRYWPLALFYVMAESWATIIFSVCFFGFVNELVKIESAHRSYPLINLAGNVSAIFTGAAVAAIEWAPWGTPGWAQSLTLLVSLILVSGTATLLLFNRLIAKHPLPEVAENRQKKSSMSFLETLKYLATSRYTLAIACIVLSFNLILNLSEVLWKDQVLELYPDPNEYNLYMNNVTAWIGLISTLITLFFTSGFLSRFGWTKTALVTPLVTWFSGLLFFLAIPASPQFLIVGLGSIHICLSRSCRYTLFDPTKEMAFIPLPSEEKLKCKTQIDGISSRLGKGISSLSMQFMLIFLPSVLACAPYIFSLFTVAIGLTLVSIRTIGKTLEPIRAGT